MLFKYLQFFTNFNGNTDSLEGAFVFIFNNYIFQDFSPFIRELKGNELGVIWMILNMCHKQLITSSKLYIPQSKIDLPGKNIIY